MPPHYDRWSGAHLVQGCRRLTSGFGPALVADAYFAGVFLGALSTRMLVQGVRNEM